MEITAQTYQLISLIGFILAAVFCVIAVVLWFRFDIREVIGELSGRTQKKRIEQMRKDNDNSGKKQFRPVSVVAEGGKITNPAERNFTLKKKGGTETAALSAGSKEPETAALSVGSTEPETAALSAGSTEPETVPLTGMLPELKGNQTSLLNNEAEHPDESEPQEVVFRMIQDIVIIHTGETI